MKLSTLCLKLMVFLPVLGWANNLQISGVSATTTQLTFNIQWDNSWNIENLSRDAAWVFVKFQDCGTANKSWDHRNLSTVSANHSVTGGVLKIDAVTDGRGVFIYRSAFGGGNNASAAVTLTFATAFTDISQVNFDVVGIEMVFVPQGAFTVGDGQASRTFGSAMNNTTPRLISSEAGLASRNLSSFNDVGTAGTDHPAIPGSFPKGFNAFYCMKYEITQAQYVHFLNSLPVAYQSSRTAVSPQSAAGTYAMHTGATPGAGTVRRSYIRIQTPASATVPVTPAVYAVDRDNDGNYNESEDGGNIACGFLSWADLLAYLDWSALRPMTELEFEKACRGPISPLAGEFAWGSNATVQAINSGTNETGITNPGLPGEVSTASGAGLSAYNNTSGTLSQYNSPITANSGPFRVGFAAGSATNRQTSGASYYGIMEMSGNVFEQTMIIGKTHNDVTALYAPTTLTAVFDGTLGDGLLSSNGEADQSTWNVSDFRYSILRGGSYLSPTTDLQVSSRYFTHPLQLITPATATWPDVRNDQRKPFNGGRGVRQF